ncbi:MAG: TonB-dependent receptor [Salinimicrobium sp.]
MERILTIIFYFLFSAALFAQTNSFSGRVLDAETGEPLADAVVKIGNKTITSTSKNGFFDTQCLRGKKLRVSLPGYGEFQTLIDHCEKRLEIELQPEVNELATIELTGRHARNLLGKPVSEVHLKAAELHRGPGIFLDDAINENVPGVTMNRRAVSSGQQFNIRGYGNGVGFRGASNNFDGQGYKVYLNNIPVTDAEGITQMDDIDFASLGGVEVVKGPAGSLYGFAIAGVVKLHTLQPLPGETSIAQHVTFGAYGLLRLTSRFASAGENYSILTNYGHQTSDGFMAHTASDKDFANLLLNFTPSEKQEISTYFGYSNSYDQRGGELSIEQFEQGDYSGNSRYIKNNAHSEVISFRAGLNHRYEFNKWLSNNISVFGTGVSSNSSSAGGWTDNDPLNYGLRSEFNFDLDLSEAFELTGIAGLELQQQRARIMGYRMTEDPENPDGYNIIGAQKADEAAVSGTSSYFTEWTLQMPWELSFTAGLGMSNMSIQLENRMYDFESSRDREVTAEYNNLYSPHFALNKIFNDNFSVYLSYSSAYNAPVSGNIVLSTTGGLNTGLEPEKGEQWEIGSKGSFFGKLDYQLALYRTRFENKFTSVAVPLDENTTAYTYIANGGSQLHRGVEFLTRYSAYRSGSGFFSAVTPYFNYTYSDHVYEDFQYETLDSEGNKVVSDYSGNAVAGVAPWVVNAGIDFATNTGFYGNFGYSYRDAMPFTSDGENITDPYNLLHAKLGYTKNLGRFDLDLFAGAENLTGTRYYYMVFLNQLPDAYLPAPKDVNFYGGLNLKMYL